MDIPRNHFLRVFPPDPDTGVSPGKRENGKMEEMHHENADISVSAETINCINRSSRLAAANRFFSSPLIKICQNYFSFTPIYVKMP
jgi:hypothetical protein